jgi:hypothetical protein
MEHRWSPIELRSEAAHVPIAISFGVISQHVKGNW